MGREAGLAGLGLGGPFIDRFGKGKGGSVSCTFPKGRIAVYSLHTPAFFILSQGACSVGPVAGLVRALATPMGRISPGESAAEFLEAAHLAVA